MKRLVLVLAALIIFLGIWVEIFSIFPQVTERWSMKTFLPKPDDKARNWFVVDAADKPLGKLAVRVANLLRGRGKVTFTPQVDLAITNISSPNPGLAPDRYPLAPRN